MKNGVKNKNIVLLSPLPPPVGGIATWTVQLLDYYQKSVPTDRYHLTHYNTAIQFKRITDKGAFKRIVAGVRDFLWHYKNIKKTFDAERVDVAHITSSGSIGLFKDFFNARFFKKKGARVIIHYRFGRIVELHQRKNWEWKMLVRLSRYADKVIVLDSKSKTTLESEDVNCCFLPNPISADKVNVFSGSTVREKGRVVFVGHVTFKKGIYELIEVLRELDMNCKLRIVGPYEEDTKAALLELAGEKSDRVEFVGQLSGTEVLNELQVSKVFVLPSHTEGFPNAVLEAMAMGCCIIASSVGAIPDMLNGDCGVCIAPQKTSEMKVALEKVLTDEDYAQRSGTNARHKVMREYTLERIYKKIEELWLED